MSLKITQESVKELHKEFGSLWLANLTVDEVLTRFEAKEFLPHVKAEEMLPYLKPEEVFPHFKPVDRLAGISLSERFVGVEPEEIEDYLKQLKRQQH